MRTLQYFVFCCLSLAILSCGSGKTNEQSAAEKPVANKFKIKQLLEKNTCFACHKENEKLVGPPYVEIAKRNYSNERIVELIYKPEPENWPDYPAPMIALPHLDKEELLDIAQWINSLN
ncbi:MAG: cytochrome c [Reichenbachiella sp.]|uniref:c-type cytochrome n=1 Tax=Reichenbachiella sp. TaxID=2184521 RepID=UPI0029661C70|nr:cytochrome c [Reichenbachiella sp.]MDW3210434.1 cytochrome c [Reichenbachiella sp.]